MAPPRSELMASSEAARRLLNAVQGHEANPALLFEGRSFTYGDLDALSIRYAAGLSDLGVRSRDRVAVWLPACPEAVVALLGHFRSGVVHVPVHPGYPAAELRHVLLDSGARAIVMPEGPDPARILNEAGPLPDLGIRIVIGGSRAPDIAFGDVCARSAASSPPPPRPADEATALLIYTSGTTGRSKGVELSCRSVVANISALTKLWRFEAADRVVVPLPLFHVHGLCIGVIGSLLAGATLQLFPRFDAQRVIEAFSDGATVLLAVPTMYVRLLERISADAGAARTLSRARLFTSGSAPLAAADFAAFEAATSHRILERYGMTETLFTLSNPFEGERRPGTVGLPVPGCEVRIVDEDSRDSAPGEAGELLVKSNGILTAYHGRPEETAASFRGGWFATGDMARRDPDGRVAILGRRASDFIKTGGFKVSAREVEDVLRQHPGVREAAVVGVPDRVFGQRVVAAVVARESADLEALRRELEAVAASALVEYKRPRELRFLDSLPRNAMGKVQKHLLAGSS